MLRLRLGWRVFTSIKVYIRLEIGLEFGLGLGIGVLLWKVRSEQDTFSRK